MTAVSPEDGKSVEAEIQPVERARAAEAGEPRRNAERASGGHSGGAKVRITRGDASHMRPVEWAWDGYLAHGKVHLIAGAPSTGNTAAACSLAAGVTQGGRGPDGGVAEPGDVLSWGGEDAPDDTLGRRLHAAGADLSRVHFVAATHIGGKAVQVDPAEHFEALAETAATPPILRLMNVDPMVEQARFVAGTGTRTWPFHHGYWHPRPSVGRNMMTGGAANTCAGCWIRTRDRSRCRLPRLR